MNRDSVYATDDDFLSKSMDFTKLFANADPRYLQEYNFFGPMSARLGIKFLF